MRVLAWLMGALAMLPLPASAADPMVLIEAGPFLMGSDRDDPGEAPAHRLSLPGFWIDPHKVTNRQFAAFLNARGLTSPEGEDYFDWDDADARIHRQAGAFTPDPGFDDHPVVEVSWFGARDYCAWLGRRLPTEAEWEKAARGSDGRRYPWGGDAPTPAHAVFGRRYGGTEPTGARPAGVSPAGVHDMLGNLREWTSTQHRPYPYGRGDGREDSAPGASRVVRGASHDDGAESLRVTVRRHYERSGTARGHHHVGFRCARSADSGGR